MSDQYSGFGYKHIYPDGCYHIVYQPFFDECSSYKPFFSYLVCSNILNKNNLLIKFNQPDLKSGKYDSYYTVLSYLYMITDCLYIFMIKDTIINYIDLNKNLTDFELKENIKYYIDETNRFIGSHLTNMPICSKENNVVSLIKSKKVYKGFSEIIKELHKLCEISSEKNFRKELDLLIIKISQYEKIDNEKLDVFLEKEFPLKTNF